MASDIKIHADGSITVNGRITDIGIRRADHYKISRRAYGDAVPLANKLGALIGMRCFAVADHSKGRTTKAELIEAISAALCSAPNPQH